MGSRGGEYERGALILSRALVILKVNWPEGPDEGAMVERFFVGPDALIGPLDGSFRRGISPPAGGE